MRADLPATVAAAIERQRAPALVFDKARISANLQEVATAARAHDIRVLFAAKSFPHPVVWELASTHVDGFDVASASELAGVPSARIVSVADPTGGALRSTPRSTQRLIVACETVAQILAAPGHAEIALRISASITGTDPAVGAILDGTGHRRSRFGVDAVEALRAMGHAAGPRRIGLHVHHGPVTATSGERFIQTARAALALASEADVRPAFIDLGGSWHGIADLPSSFATVRAALRDYEILVEPGRAMVREAGFACGRVTLARELADRSIRVVDLSRLCHLRWSPVEIVGSAPHAGSGQKTIVLGPTCSEEDLVGEWTVSPGMLDEGSPFLVRGVTGYSVAWNTSFGGVPPASVIFA